MTRHLFALYLFYGLHFIGLGMTTYAPKYYGAIGLNNMQIGLISAVPAFIAIFAQPMWGVLSDRSRYKRNTIIFGLIAAGICAFAAERLSSQFWLLLTALTLLNTFTLHAVPVGSAITLEYTAAAGKNYGPIRLTGTIGYQIGILLIGVMLSENLTGLYTVYGAVMLITALCARLMPPVRGHQHGAKRVPLTHVLKDRRLLALMGLAFLVQVCAQFYMAFFSKHLGDIGMSNTMTGIITILSVILEIPFLLVGDRLYRKLTIWQWLWVGLFVNALRFVGLSYARTPAALIITLLPSVFLLACYEFYPAIYISRAVSKEVAGSAQNLYQTVSYGIARIVGALLGGVLAEAVGIAPVFRAGGVMLLAASALTFVPLMKTLRE